MSKIKICGIRRMEDIAYVNEEKPDYIGFVFAKSKRRITLEQAIELKSHLNKQILPVGVFVNETVDNILKFVESDAISMIQLHGDETLDYIRSLKEKTVIPVIKAIRPRSEKEIIDADKLPCDFLLLDTYSKDAYGGTGETFSWEIIPSNLQHPFFLAGGLNVNNIKPINCYGYDISGGVETEGIKDQTKIKNIISVIRNFNIDKKGGKVNE